MASNEQLPAFATRNDSNWNAEGMRRILEHKNTPSLPLLRTAFHWTHAEGSIAVDLAVHCLVHQGYRLESPLPQESGRARAEAAMRTARPDLFDRPHLYTAHWAYPEMLTSGALYDEHTRSSPSLYQAFLRVAWSVKKSKAKRYAKGETESSRRPPTRRSSSIARNEDSTTIAAPTPFAARPGQDLADLGITSAHPPSFSQSSSKRPAEEEVVTPAAKREKISLHDCFLSIGKVTIVNRTLTICKILMPLGNLIEPQGTFDWDFFLKKMRLSMETELYTFSRVTNSINGVTYYDIDAELRLQYEALSPYDDNSDRHRYLVFFLGESQDTVAKVPLFLRAPHLLNTLQTSYKFD